jgi:hypothetical protein
VLLYRAADFPLGWTLDSVLLDGVQAYDVTVLRREDGFWMFASVPVEGARLSHELSVFFAPALRGPWEAHPANPVVSDVRLARPAGRLFEHQGRLIRPSQDCSSRYGRAVVFNRIEALSPTEYREVPVAVLEPDRARGALAVHTYNADAGLEIIDVRRPALRLPPALRRTLDSRFLGRAAQNGWSPIRTNGGNPA